MSRSVHGYLLQSEAALQAAIGLMGPRAEEDPALDLAIAALNAVRRGLRHEADLGHLPMSDYWSEWFAEFLTNPERYTKDGV